MTGEVRLRDVTEDDLPVLFEHQLDPEATAMAAFPARDWEAFSAHWTQKVLGDPAVLKKAIVIDGEVAGNILSFVQGGERKVGYWIGRPFWGRGIATRALGAFLQEVPERPLHAHVAKHNVGSLRVLQKCGFTVTGEDHWVIEATGEEGEELLLTLDDGPR